jgi:hypothetical protein
MRMAANNLLSGPYSSIYYYIDEAVLQGNATALLERAAKMGVQYETAGVAA